MQQLHNIKIIQCHLAGAVAIPTLPPMPSTHQARESALLASQAQPPSLEQVINSCERLMKSLTYTQEEVRAVEQATKTQRDCERWHEERKLRITASNFGLVVKRKRSHASLAQQLLYKRCHGSGVAALVWGQQHEKDALVAYKQSLAPGTTVDEAGIFVSACGFLGASPDGIVMSGDKPIKLIEVKCPYRARNSTVHEMCSDKSFHCSLDDNLQPMLKRTHDYYYQVQGQMAVSNIHQCDFVVWTPKGYTIELITFDQHFWSETCYPSLRKFYFNLLLPEIIYPKHPEVPNDYSPLNLHSLIQSAD